MSLEINNIDRIELLKILLEELGDLITKMGMKEKSTGQIDFYKRFTNDTFQIISDFTTLSAEELGTLMKVLLGLVQYTDNFGKLFELQSDEKIKVGSGLKNLADELNNLQVKIQSRISSK